jgi:hypothetical protein
VLVGGLWHEITASGTAAPAPGWVLPGLVLTALGIGLALPTASIAITSGVQASEQGVAGALFTTSQQTAAAVGLAVLATAAAQSLPRPRRYRRGGAAPQELTPAACGASGSCCHVLLRTVRLPAAIAC